MIDTTSDKAVEQAELRFNHLVREWDEAQGDCSHLYNLWQRANRRREMLAVAKNNAWGELEMARAVSNGTRESEAT